jgi:hypothetical protein
VLQLTRLGSDNDVTNGAIVPSLRTC